MVGRHANYFDIDDILVSDERVTCTFNVNALGLSFLERVGSDSDGQNDVAGVALGEEIDAQDGADSQEKNTSAAGGSSSAHSQGGVQAQSDAAVTSMLRRGSRVELPLWLAETLSVRGVLSIHLPRFFSSRAKNDLNAGAMVVNLHERCPFYFELGARLSRLLQNEDGDEALDVVLRRAYAERCWRVVNGPGWEGREKGAMMAMKRLDNIERRLYLISSRTLGAYERWQERSGGIIGATPTILGKRPRVRP